MGAQRTRAKGLAQLKKEFAELGQHCWSRESYWETKALMYLCEILTPRGKGQHKRSRWQEFLSRELKAGSTLREAAEKWSARKGSLSQKSQIRDQK
jgi:hypothetical protein